MEDNSRCFAYNEDIYKALIENSRLVRLNLGVLNVTEISQNQLKDMQKYQQGPSLIFKLDQKDFTQGDVENILLVHTPIGTTHFRYKQKRRRSLEHTAEFRFYRILPENPYK